MRIVLSMLFLGVVLATVGAVMMTIATAQLSRVNEGHYLPMIIGRFAVASPFKVTALRVGAQTVAAVATWIVAVTTWDHRTPWPSFIATVTTLIAAVAIPVIAMTWKHNRHFRRSNR
ncbi:hypothetical protein [Rhodococcus sp. MALMAid1271]|uniref:hypothetical protein n=1 Tax=Rhodococcus sp. MALMAid1271 TaxID=3411744 RepID=UPI003BA1C035